MKIDETLVAKLVASQFPHWSDLRIEPVEFGGWDNRTFNLGDAMSVRLPSAERYAEKVEKEQKWLPHLAAGLSLPIPRPLAMGRPEFGYPWNWSIYQWIEGENATHESIADLAAFARSLGHFLLALHKIDPTDGAQPGPHNFFRGGDLAVYDQESRDSISALEGKIDTRSASAVWEKALASIWERAPVWIHGDLSPSNLLVKDGEIAAVIDFGGCGTGDPACDLTIAWTFFSGESREAFRSTVALDEATWERARGWAIWKGLILLAEHIDSNPEKAKTARRVIDEVIAEHAS